MTSDVLGDRLGLGECGRTPYRRLSGGQQQRLGLAMAVVGRPELVFVDEPTAGMDPQARHTTWDLLRELREAGVTVVLTTHYIEEAERLADQVHIIDRGRLVMSGTPADLTGGGVRRLEDVFLDHTGTVACRDRLDSPRSRRRAARPAGARAGRWRCDCCCATASSCYWRW